MPLGLANVLLIFQSHINARLEPFLDVLVIAYLKNKVVYLTTAGEHRKHARIILTALLKVGLYLKLRKCKCNAKGIGFVGFIITLENDHMECNQIAIIEEWPMPGSHRDIEVFL
jgi:hypothetical protein